VGGVYRITEAELAEKKSQAALMPSTPPRRKEMLRQMPKGPLQKRPPVASEAQGATPASPVAPRPETLPVTKSAEREGFAPKLHAPEPPFPTAPISQPAFTEPAAAAPDAPAEAPAVEGFRPPTRRISRRAAADKTTATTP
jgi:hypothetical protein